MDRVGGFFGLKNSGQIYSIIYQGFGWGALEGADRLSPFYLGGFGPTFKSILVLSIISGIIAWSSKAPGTKQAQEKEKWALTNSQSSGVVESPFFFFLSLFGSWCF